ncbi:MAG: pirin family protein [Myxococcota bacterium]
MSVDNDPTNSEHTTSDAELIETIIVPRTRDLGGFEVGRVLPSQDKRLVGPFIFFDRMGPSELAVGEGVDVRPHPHIGLATVTYLFDGEIMHRDSLGSVQPIRPGEVNWMTAGKGIAHSERSPQSERSKGVVLNGLQAWVALPGASEEVEPAFVHHPEGDLPQIEDTAVTARIISGGFAGARSPVKTYHETLYVDVQLAAGGKLPVDPSHEERAVFVVTGSVSFGDQNHGPGELLILKPGVSLTVTSETGARFMILGGEPMDGERYIW